MDNDEACVCSRPDLRPPVGATFCYSCGCMAFNRGADALLGTDKHFSYAPLRSASSIRLMRLLGGSREDVLHCEIFHASLHEHPEFEGLSYVWGQNISVRSIRTQNGSLGITENCADALRDLRYTYRDRVLWVDAVCIDQSNIQEKSQQVPLMNIIYAKARRVVLYVGADTRPKIKLFFDYLQRENPTTVNQVTQPALSTFLSKPWFSRVWVLQEVAVAKEAVVMWGSATLDWKYFSPAHLSALELLPIDNTGNVPPVLRLAQDQKKPLKDFASLISTGRNCVSTDPRDKVYALLGLLSDFVEHPVVPDYSKSVEDLYVEVTVHVIRSYNHLDILSDVGNETEQEAEAINNLKAKVTDFENVVGHGAMCIEDLQRRSEEAQQRAIQAKSAVIHAERRERDAWKKLRQKTGYWDETEERSEILVELSNTDELWQRYEALGRLWRAWKYKEGNARRIHEYRKAYRYRALWKKGEGEWRHLRKEVQARLFELEKKEQTWNAAASGWLAANQDWENSEWREYQEAEVLWNTAVGKEEEARREIGTKGEDPDEQAGNVEAWLTLLDAEQWAWEEMQIKGNAAWRKLDEKVRHDPGVAGKAWQGDLAEDATTIEEAQEIWETADMVLREAREHPLVKEAAAASQAYTRLSSDMASAASQIRKLAYGELHSRTCFPGDEQPQWKRTLPSWVPDLDKKPCLESLAQFRPKSTLEEPVAQLCCHSDAKEPPMLRVRILKLDEVIGMDSKTRRCCQAYSNREASSDGLDDVPDVRSDLEDRGGHSTAVDDLRTHADDMITSKRFYQGRRCMQTTRSWAQCSSQAEASDEICMLYGAVVPFVLRPTQAGEQRYKLVGECWLRGFKEPKFAYDYLELLGDFKQYFNASSADELPWQVAFLE